MLFELKYTSHPIEKVNQVVYDFIRNSIADGVYSHNLFPAWFVPVLVNAKGDDNLDDKFRTAYLAFQALPVAERQAIFDDFLLQISIYELCGSAYMPINIQAQYSDLHEALDNVLVKHFFKTTLRRSVTLQTQLGTSLVNHYRQFKLENNSGRVCPFCGLHEYAIPDGEAQDDYDHWLYKSKYPLLAINFSNLVPMCGSCNDTGVKGIKDVIVTADTNVRRSSFYPYLPHGGITITVREYIPQADIIDPEEQVEYPYGKLFFNINAVLPVEEDKVNSWREVFNIDQRFHSFASRYYISFKEEFHDDYLPHHPHHILNADPTNQRNILTVFRDQLGNAKRRTGIILIKAYLDFIMRHGNEALMATFCNINLAA